MSYSISGSGHIDPAPDEDAAAVESELVEALRTALAGVLGTDRFGIASLQFYGQHTGTVDLTADAPAAEPVAE